MKIYYSWYSAYKNSETAESSYKKNLKLLKNIREKKKDKIARQTDVDKLHLQALSKQENLITLSNNYNKFLHQIKQAINYNKKTVLIPEYPSNYKNFKINFQKDYEKFRNTGRTYNMLNLFEKKGILERDKFADDLLPSANLLLGYSIQGSDYVLQDSSSKIFAGFTFDIPFMGQKERAGYETSKINLKKIALSSTNKRVQLDTEIKTIHEQIKSYKKLQNIDEEKIRLSENILKDEEKNYRYGRISLNDFISAQNKLDENKYSEILLSIQLDILIIEWKRLTDQLINKNEIKYEDIIKRK